MFKPDVKWKNILKTFWFNSFHVLLSSPVHSEISMVQNQWTSNVYTNRLAVIVCHAAFESSKDRFFFFFHWPQKTFLTYTTVHGVIRKNKKKISKKNYWSKRKSITVIHMIYVLFPKCSEKIKIVFITVKSNIVQQAIVLKTFGNKKGKN